MWVQAGVGTGTQTRDLVHCRWELQVVLTGPDGPAAKDTCPGLQAREHTLDALRWGQDVPQAKRIHSLLTVLEGLYME